MSTDVGFFFNCPRPPHEVAAVISEQLGVALERVQDHDGLLWGGVLFGAWFTLVTDHGLVNDGELNFEDFRYDLGTTTRGSEPSRAIQVEVLALCAYALRDSPLCIEAGMLVYGVGRLLARYETRDGDWFDLVSGKRVVFPGHLVDVMARVRR